MTPTPDKPAGEAMRVRVKRLRTAIAKLGEISADDADKVEQYIAHIGGVRTRTPPPSALDEVEAVLYRVTQLADCLSCDVPITAHARTAITDALDLLTRLKDSSK